MPFFGGGGRPGMRPARGPNKLHEIGVSLADLYKGKMFTLNMKRDVLCSGCAGEGGKRMEPCGPCGGQGMRMRGVQMGPIMSMTHEPCGACGQTGKRVVEKCTTCNGKRITESESILDVVIKPGMQEGDRLTFPGQCSESPLFEQPGDVVLVIRSSTADSEKWLRRGSELTYTVTLSLAEALLGWERELEGHPSSKPLHVVWKGGVLREGEVLRIAGWGMPIQPEGLGDLRIVCRVEVCQGAWSSDELRALQSVWPSWKEPVEREGSVVPIAETVHVS